jgi:hypothetical protein
MSDDAPRVWVDGVDVTREEPLTLPEFWRVNQLPCDDAEEAWNRYKLDFRPWRVTVTRSYFYQDEAERAADRLRGVAAPSGSAEAAVRRACGLGPTDPLPEFPL